MNSVSFQNKNKFYHLKQQSQPTFKAAYGLRGSVSDIEKVSYFMTHMDIAHKIFEPPFASLKLQNNGSEKTVGILTGWGSEKRALETLKNPSEIINAQDVLYSDKLEYFNFDYGFKTFMRHFQRKNFDFTAPVNSFLNPKESMNLVESGIIKFPKPSDLKDSLELLKTYTAEIKKSWRCFNFTENSFLTDFLGNKNALEEVGEFAGAPIIGLKGAGGFSMVLQTDRNQILKIGDEANIPEVDEIFDIETFDKKIIPFSGSLNLYCALEKNGKNWMETKIAPDDVIKVSKQITASGKKLHDFNERQIVKVDHKPFLIDPDCAEGRALFGK